MCNSEGAATKLWLRLTAASPPPPPHPPTHSSGVYQLLQTASFRPEGLLRVECAGLVHGQSG